MSLSKARNRERMRKLRSLVQPNLVNVQPKNDALQSKSSGIETLLNSTAPPVVQPNPYLAGHLKHCPDYNVNKPGNHWETCPFINPDRRNHVSLCMSFMRP